MRSPTSFLPGLVALLALLAAGRAATAADLESLVSPGTLAQPHAKFDTECAKCHTPFAKDAQRGLCLACHDKVAADLKAGQGFHSRMPTARTAQCRVCHGEHKGRKFDITGLDRDTFNHALTDFALAGGHLKVTCDGCHKPAAKFRDAPRACNACHAKDDVHRKALGEKCETCHVDAGWKQAKFDHTKQTKYPLTGAHARVDCVLCHADQHYKDTPTTCVACHRINDAHKGSRGDACQDCHSTTEWKKPTFDHLKSSKQQFALTGDHAKIACVACHVGNDFKKKLGRECVDCHRADDIHKGANGTKCETCHGTEAWRNVRFDHAKETHFPLRGAHEKVTCTGCHKGPVHEVKLKMECVACHAADDTHKGSLGKECQRCHNDVSWRDRVAFDHDLTSFPLVGLHATVACEACHVDKRYKGTNGKCIDCHRKNDVHKAALGAACETCHNPNDWRLWSFDHNRQTDFRLDGAHTGLACAACHRKPMRTGQKLPGQCVDCHRRDDIHGGQFGGDCGRCHNTGSFAGARMRN